jgi:DNA-binding response OmpR family regulator
MTKKLLIIDDQVGTTRIVGLIARQLGFDVRIAVDPTQGLDAFIDYRPDILILDMIMPEKDGIDVLNEVLLTGIPVHIVLTSGLSQGYLRQAENLARFHGADRVSVLRKPFRREELVAQLEAPAARAECAGA